MREFRTKFPHHGFIPRELPRAGGLDGKFDTPIVGYTPLVSCLLPPLPFTFTFYIYLSFFRTQLLMLLSSTILRILPASSSGVFSSLSSHPSPISWVPILKFLVFSV